ncbi:MAG: hypothetical protein NVS2B8_04440 [Vulcanimicrobiaceae bacterium]
MSQHIELDQANDVAILRIGGAVDLAGVATLEAAIDVFDAERSLIVSLEECERVDEAVLPMLRRHDHAIDGRFVVLVRQGSSVADILGDEDEHALCVVTAEEAALALARV